MSPLDLRQKNRPSRDKKQKPRVRLLRACFTSFASAPQRSVSLNITRRRSPTTPLYPAQLPDSSSSSTNAYTPRPNLGFLTNRRVSRLAFLVSERYPSLDKHHFLNTFDLVPSDFSLPKSEESRNFSALQVLTSAALSAGEADKGDRAQATKEGIRLDCDRSTLASGSGRGLNNATNH